MADNRVKIISVDNLRYRIRNIQGKAVKRFLYKLYLKMNDVCIDSTALIGSRNIGPKTRIWAFTNIMKDVNIGSNCNICDRCFIESGVYIGDNVTIKTGVSLWEGLYVEDDVFIGPGVQFCNDLNPRSKKYIEPMKTILKKGCSIGSGAVILPGLMVGKNAMVGAGSVVVENVPDNCVVVGNPAKIIRNQDKV